MNHGHFPSTEIVKRDEQAFRATATTIISFILIVLTGGGVMLAANHHLIASSLSNFVVIGLFLGWVLFLFVYVKPGIAPPEEAFGEEYLRATIDVQHRRWCFIIGAAIANLLVSAGTLTSAFKYGASNLGLYLGPFVFSFVVVAVVTLLTVSFGPGFFLPFYQRALNDELIRSQQARIAQVGYTVAVLEMCVIASVGPYKPQLALTSIPFAIAAAIALPAVYFLALQWLASRDG